MVKGGSKSQHKNDLLMMLRENLFTNFKDKNEVIAVRKIQKGAKARERSTKGQGVSQLYVEKCPTRTIPYQKMTKRTTSSLPNV